MKARHTFSYLGLGFNNWQTILLLNNNSAIYSNHYSNRYRKIFFESYAYLKSTTEVVLKAFNVIRAISVVFSFHVKKLSRLLFTTLMVIT